MNVLSSEHIFALGTELFMCRLIHKFKKRLRSLILTLLSLCKVVSSPHDIYEVHGISIFLATMFSLSVVFKTIC
jgi:hypothetical protein